MKHIKHIANRLGLGRAAYRLVYRPIGLVEQSWREGGPLEQYRTRLGHRAMVAAAETLHALPMLPDPPHRAEVAFLTGPRFWDQTLFCMVSLQLQVPYRITPVIHDDGRLDRTTIDRLLRVMPWSRIVTAEENDAKLEQVLPQARYPNLRSRRRDFPLMRKLVDVHAGSDEFRLFADSDMLFFQRPVELIDWFARPHWFYLQDCVTSYGYPRAYLDELAGAHVPDMVNSGFYAIDGAAIDWEKIEFWCRRQLDDHGPHYLQEQTLTAMLFAGVDALALPRDRYVVKPDAAEGLAPTAVLHHYVDVSKHSYFRHGWRLIFDAAKSLQKD